MDLFNNFEIKVSQLNDPSVIQNPKLKELIENKLNLIVESGFKVDNLLLYFYSYTI